MRDRGTAHVVCFGPFELDLRAGELAKGGSKLLLQEQPFQILKMLVENAGQVVTREEIRKTLWPNDTVVEFDHSINAAIKKLRQALGDCADAPCYVETVARRGYRLLVPAEWMEAQPADGRDAKLQEGAQPPQLIQGSLVGRRVSHYRVLGVLGGGGMGLVYRAEDIKLGRGVALKFLPDELVHDPVALDRFEREARAASALNHPHICTIYEFEEYEGQPFIVMELLDGQTLRERIDNASAPLQTNELIDLAIQITDGLDAAHQKGIIHRDIKTANIFLTNCGEAKILDFGLAKIVDLDEHPHNPLGGEVDETCPPREATSMLSLDSTQTHTGAMIGTVSYMSPEQMRGEKLDARTDLFSFGLVLYEMTTAQRAFRGSTVTQVNEAILHRTPTHTCDWSAELPPEFEEIIKKALEKDRGMRYQSAAEIRTDLQRLKRDTKAGSPANVATPRRTHSLPLWWRSKLALGIGGLIIVCMILAASFFWRHRYSSTELSSLPPVHKPVTFLGDAFDPAISPDGKFVAYVTTESERKQKLMMQALSGGPNVQLLVADSLEWPKWSPDGSELMLSGMQGQIWKLFVVSRFGGEPRSIGKNALSCWLPDGSHIVAAAQNPETGIQLLDKQTGAGKRIPGPGYQFLFDIDCSAKSGMLLLLTKTSEKYQIWTMKLDGSEQRKLIEEQKEIYSVRWSPTGGAIYYFRDEGNAVDLVKLSVSGQPTESSVLVSGLEAGRYFTLSADGSQLAYTRIKGYSNLWLAELPAPGTATKIREMPLTSGTWTYAYPSISPDDRWVTFSRYFGEKSNIYKMPVGGGEPIQLTFFDAAETTSPAWSPDGQQIAFVSDQGGVLKVWVVGADGGTARQLDKTNASGTNKFLAWFPSPEIVYQQPGLHNLRRLNHETQEEESVLPVDSEGWLPSRPSFSPNGKTFAIVWNRGQEQGLWVVTPEKHSERLLSPRSYDALGWSRGGDFLYACELGERKVVRIDLENAKETLIPITVPGFINTGSVSTERMSEF